MNFDLVQHPIILGQTVAFGTSADDRVIALEADTGRVRWQFTASRSGPVRLDGVARSAVRGQRRRLALRPVDRRRSRPLAISRWTGRPQHCLGNERLISRWPIRGGPVVLDDVVYFTAGIWPTDGVFLHALRAATGEVLWTNDRAGDIEIGQPHGGATARSGVAPQGYLLADEERIYVPTGRAVPAVFRRNDGELLYYHLQQNHTIGGSRAMLVDRFSSMADSSSRRNPETLRCGREGVVGTSAATWCSRTAATWPPLARKDIEQRDRKGQPIRFRGLEPVARSLLPTMFHRTASSRRWRCRGSATSTRARMRFQVEARQPPASINQHIAQTRPDIERGAGTNPFLPTSAEKDVEVIVAGEEAVCGGDGWVRVVDVANRRVRWSNAVAGRAARAGGGRWTASGQHRRGTAVLLRCVRPAGG